MTVLQVVVEKETERERERGSDGVAKCENHRVNQYEKRALEKEAIKKEEAEAIDGA